MIELSITESGQFVFVAIFILSIFFVFYVALAFIARLNELRLRITELDAELEQIRPRIPACKERVDELRRTLVPRKHERQKMADYHYRLVRLSREAEAREQTEQQQKQRKQEEKHEIRRAQRKL